MPQTQSSSISRVVSENHCPARTFERHDGLTVVHQHIPHSPVVVTDVWVNAGGLRRTGRVVRDGPFS